ncbi:MAG: FAD-dependent oxidoreductase, partial [Planctomycetes bacterium]|nr:FAD-dependent oxidoreductase [Planctomycetota bacterium]
MSERVLDADVGIVGAGPAGMAAANVLAAAGVSACVLDEGHRAGGQIFRQLPAGAAAPSLREPPSHHHGHDLLAAFTRSGVTLRSGASVWDAKVGRLWFEQDGQSWLLRCKHVLLAPGAYDRCVPFPGWTLPGVLTAGALQVMVRGFGVVPGRRALVVGSGPLLLPTVTALVSAGVEVVAALEASSRWRALRALPGVLGNGARLREAFWYARQLLRAGVRLQWGWTVFRCEGDGRVQRAVVGRVDAAGNPRPETARTIEVDVVGAGFGLVPSVELGQLLGCATTFDGPRGGHRLVIGAAQATNVPGVFAAGEICGVGGAEVAAAEGELAAHGILQSLRGSAVPAAVVAKAARERRAADAMLRAFAPLPGLVRLAEPATVVCRCEDVPLQTVRAAAACHGDSLRAIKVGCRAGMGPCQGRICGPTLQAMATGDGARPSDLPVVQVPLKVVRTETILQA